MMTCLIPPSPLSFFFFNDTATTEIYPLSLHDALPISHLLLRLPPLHAGRRSELAAVRLLQHPPRAPEDRSEEHTSELQSPDHLVCRLLLEKKKNKSHEKNLYTIYIHTKTKIEKIV